MANRFFRPPPGRLRAVTGFAAAALLPGVAWAELTVEPGDRIRPLTDHTCRVGSVIAIGEGADQAIARAEAAVAAVRFDVEPEAASPAAGTEENHREALPRYGLAH